MGSVGAPQVWASVSTRGWQCSGGVAAAEAFPPTASAVTHARTCLERVLHSKLGSCFHKVMGIYGDVFSYTTHSVLCDESFLIFL